MRIERLSPNRTFIYHLLRRSVRFHTPITVTAALDITETLARIERERARGRRVGLVSLFIKATAQALVEHPRFNQRLFHGLFGRPRIATFDETSCNTVVAREASEGGEELLIPMVLRHVDTMSVDEIQDEIRRYKSTPLPELRAVAKNSRISKLPRWLIKLLHWKFRRDPKFLISKVGTYGVSALPHRESGVTSTFTPTTQTVFFPTSIEDRVVAIDGQPVVRTMLLCTVTADHFVIDGLDMQRMGRTLKRMVEDPSLLLGVEEP